MNEVGNLAALSRVGSCCLTALLIALTLCLFTGERAEARPLVTGIDFVDDYSAATFEKVDRTGVQFVRLNVKWISVAPLKEPNSWQPTDPEDPHYDWREVDTAVTRIAQEGFVPMIMIFTAPAWAEGCKSPTGMAESTCSPSPADLASFATAAARRYSGQIPGLPRVRYWQGLNEPNLSLYFNPQFERGKPVSPALYRELANAFYFAVKSVSASNMVIAAGLGPIAIPRYTIGPMRFARLLLCMNGRRNPRPAPGNCGGGVHFDIFDIHPYTTGGPSHKGGADDVQMGDLDKLVELLRAADAAGRIQGRFEHTPLWITEFSWDSKPPDPGGLPMSTLSRWTSEALYRAWDAGVDHFFWLILSDVPRTPEVPFSRSIEAGLFFHGAAAKPKTVLYAFRFPFVGFPVEKGLLYWGRTPTSEGGAVSVQVQQGGAWRVADVARADRNGIFTGIVDTSYGQDKRGRIRARYRGETTVPFSMTPIRDFHQPPFG